MTIEPLNDSAMDDGERRARERWGDEIWDAFANPEIPSEPPRSPVERFHLSAVVQIPPEPQNGAQ